MFRKELADVGRQTLFFLAAVLALPAVLGLLKVVRGPYLESFLPALQGGLLFWALFLGASLFGRERRERALEYALTLPYSRPALLVRLAGARAVVLAALCVLLWILEARWGGSFSAFEPDAWFPVYAALFVISASLSPLIENFIALCLISLGTWYVFFFAAQALAFVVIRAKGLYIPWMAARAFAPAILETFSVGTEMLQLLLPVVPFGLALILAFRKFDIRPSRSFIKRYIKVLAASLLACIAAGFALAYLVTPSAYYRQTLLTADHKIIEFQPFRTLIRHPHGTIQVKAAHLSGWRVREEDTFLYLRDGQNNLVRLNTANGMIKTIHKAGRDESGLIDQWVYAGKLAFFSSSFNPISARLSLVILDLRASPDSRPRFIPCLHEFFESGRRWNDAPILAGAGRRDGRDFWLVNFRAPAKRPVRLWDDGRVEDLFPGDGSPGRYFFYLNGLLIRAGRSGLRIYRDGVQGFELFKSLSESFSFFPPGDDWVGDESSPRTAAIFGKRGDLIAKLDLATLEIMDVAPLKTPRGALVYAFFPDRFCLQEWDEAAASVRVSSLDDKGVTFLREFKDPSLRDRGYFLDVQREGVVLTRPHKIKAYAFPDLRELKHE